MVGAVSILDRDMNSISMQNIPTANITLDSKKLKASIFHSGRRGGCPWSPLLPIRTGNFGQCKDRENKQ